MNFKFFSAISTFLLILLCTFSAFSQDLIKNTQNGIATSTDRSANRISEMLNEVNTRTENEATNLFGYNNARMPMTHREAVKDAVYLNLDRTVLSELHKSQPKLLTLDIPVSPSQSFEVDLIKVDILADGFKAVTDKGEVVFNKEDVPGVFYWGNVKGDPSSIVSISVFEDYIEGVISDENGNYNLGKSQQKLASNYILYNDKDLKVENPFSCGTPSDKITPEKENTNFEIDGYKAAGECVNVYIEADYATYQSHGSSSTNVTNYTNALFNEVAIIYANENISIQISELYIWTSTDPYASSGGTSNALNAFKSYRSSFNGNLAHLISTQSWGGGIAWVDVLCVPSYSYAVSAGMSTTVVPFPTYSWNVMVFAHEMGHNMGSPHTQSCSWNGNNTAIDGCVNSEGGCSNGPIPPGGGTIMSYCHLNSVGTNMANGFGPQPGDLIRNRYNNASCTSACNDDPPPPPGGNGNDECANAESLQLSTTTFSGLSNTGATASESFFQNGCFYNDDPFQHTVYYTFVGDGNTYTITTTNCGSGTPLTDTQLLLLAGSCSGTVVDCNDDINEATQNYLSTLTFATQAGVNYYLLVDGWGGAEGNFCLDVEQFIAGCTDPTAINYDSSASIDDGSCIYGLANDECANATSIQLTNTTYSGLTNATATTSETSFPTGCFWSDDAYQSTIYYSFVGDGNTYNITSSNCSGAGTQLTDTQFALFDGCNGSLITCNDDIDVATNDYLSTITFGTQSGVTYYLLVDGYGGSQGEFCLNVLQVVPGCTDASALNYNAQANFDDGTCIFNTGANECSGAETLLLTNVVYPGLSNAGATTSESSTPNGCFWGNDTYTNTVYYNFVGDGATYTITSSNCTSGGTQLSDTQFSLFEGSCNGTMIACNDDINEATGNYLSTITFNTQAGVNYYLLVDGWGGQTGSYCLEFSQGTPKTIGASSSNSNKIGKGNLALNVFPNPMDNVAYIAYNLSRAENVSIAVYDITGKEVRVLVENEAQQSGKHQLSFEANDLNTGTYFIRIVTDNRQENQMIIIE